MHTADQLIAALDRRSPEAPLAATGIAELDSVTGGLVAGRIWIVVSVPGEGRTTLLTQWAVAIAQESGQAVHFVTPRERPDVIASRMAALIGKVPMSHLAGGALHQKDQEKLVLARQRIASLSLCLYAMDGDPYVPEVDPWGTPLLTAVVIDDADLVAGLTPAGLAEYAAAGHLVVISLPRHEVMTSDADEADVDPAWGRIADVILEVRHRGLSHGRPGEADLHVRHNRWGYTRTIHAQYQTHFSRFIEAGS